jgi:hypothetical protein
LAIKNMKVKYSNIHFWLPTWTMYWKLTILNFHFLLLTIYFQKLIESTRKKLKNCTEKEAATMTFEKGKINISNNFRCNFFLFFCQKGKSHDTQLDINKLHVTWQYQSNKNPNVC